MFAKHMMLEIHGGWSRAEDKKSFRIDFKNALDGDVEYPLFPDKPEVTQFNNFNLRSGGQHVWTSIIQDAFLARNMRTTYIDYEAYTPCHVFINGNYWGIYEIREKADEHFVESNYGVDADDIDLMNGWTTLAGTDTGFVNLYNWLMSHDPGGDTFYDYFAERVDVQNYVDYYIGEIYYQNIDFGGAYWGQNNIKFYRDRNGGKWRHIMYDLDGAMGWFGGSVYDNFIDLIRNPAAPSMNSQIFDRMLDNEAFRIYFINRFADLINTVFQQYHMEAEMETLTEELIEEIPRQIDRWGAPYSTINWLNYTEGILNYNSARISPARYQIKESFDLTQQRFITLDIQPPGAGYIQVSTIIPQTHPWVGVYFEDVPLQFTAIPNPGYTFSHWSAVDVIPDDEEINQSVTVFLNSSDLFEANFTGSPAEAEIIVTEINYNSENTANSGDWIELFNNGTNAIDISGWQLSDATGTNILHVPVQTILEANAYIVFTADVKQFKSMHPDVINVIGDFGFKLNNDADTLILTALNGDIIFSVAYADNADWPQGADGTGRTLELKNYADDLNDASNWFDGCMFGSPGSAYAPCSEPLVFSEINYNSADTADAGDWIEILNTSPASVDMSLWKFADKNDTIVYQIPTGTLLSSGERIVIANNTTLFGERHEEVTPLATNFYFGLDGAGEELRLFDANGVIRFSAIYNDASPWPAEADGGGKTLELVDASGIMNDASNWFAGCPEGSPAIAYDPACGMLNFIDQPDVTVWVYPNPADNYFIVHVAGLPTDNCRLSFLDITGKELFAQSLKPNQHTTIYRNHISAGLYLLKIQYDDT
ncbi:MAG: CotH kinase family protein, partial [Chitinophagales bacterium]